LFSESFPRNTTGFCFQRGYGLVWNMHSQVHGNLSSRLTPPPVYANRTGAVHRCGGGPPRPSLARHDGVTPVANPNGPTKASP
jgi:hypothetical protein